jgi:hypothetical protein
MHEGWRGNREAKEQRRAGGIRLLLLGLGCSIMRQVGTPRDIKGWGFLNSGTGIAVVYDMEADLVATVFRPEEGEAFFLGQIDAVRIDRKEWGV